MKHHVILSNLILRIGIGYVFLWSGMSKVFQGIAPSFLDELLDHLQFTLIGLSQFNLVCGIIEMIIGILFVLGLFTRLVSVVASAGLILMIVTVSLWFDFSIVWKDIALLCMSMSLLFLGAGALSVDSVIWGEKDTTA